MSKKQPKTLVNLPFIKAYILSVGMVDDSPEALNPNAQDPEEVAKLPLRYLGTDVVLKNYSIEEMAEQCHLTPVTFKRRFVKEYGCPPHLWLTRQRLGHASRLLRFSTLSIKEICYRCDFSSPSNFSRSFKHAYHCTPEEYRAKDHNRVPTSYLEVEYLLREERADGRPVNMNSASAYDYLSVKSRPLRPKSHKRPKPSTSKVL